GEYGLPDTSCRGQRQGHRARGTRQDLFAFLYDQEKWDGVGAGAGPEDHRLAQWKDKTRRNGPGPRRNLFNSLPSPPALAGRVARPNHRSSIPRLITRAPEI